MLNIGIIGCGNISDAHAEIIQSNPDAKLVAACDSEVLMAKQLCDRFDVHSYFDNVEEMLAKAKPDVVHITTPPQSHFSLGKTCLAAGCHVYMEKPFTITSSEARHLIDFANKNGLRITVGHNNQFSHATQRLRRLYQEGFCGRRIVHMESYYCYDLGDERYAKAFLGSRSHWVRRLPGTLAHNVISHGISTIAEFLETDVPQVVAMGFTSPLLRSIGENDIIDELRVIINDNDNTTAYFTFSSQMRPVLHQFRLYGSENSLILDHNHQTVVQLRGTKYKSYLDVFIPPFVFSKQYLANVMFNTQKFIQRDFHMNAGMKHLVGSFYRSITANDPLPINYRDILLTAKIMDSIFDQVKHA